MLDSFLKYDYSSSLSVVYLVLTKYDLIQTSSWSQKLRRIPICYSAQRAIFIFSW